MDRISAYNYIRSKFVGIRETRKLIKEHSLKIKYGYLSEQETTTVKNTVEKFLQERNLTLNDLKKHLVEDTEFPIHDLIYECTSVCELRTYKSIHTHIAYMYHPYIHMGWNEEEEVQLLDLVNQKGFNWKEISYHITKYKDICRMKYLSIKGELTKQNLSQGKIQELLKNMPSTDEEWGVLCAQLKMSKALVLRLLNKYLNGKELAKSENKILEITLCLCILNHNHYCKFNVNISSILEFLNTEHEIFEKIDGKTTPFISKKGKREGSVMIDGVFQRSTGEIYSRKSADEIYSKNAETCSKNDEIYSRNDETCSKKSTDGAEINENQLNKIENQLNNSTDNDDHFEQILKKMKEATNKNNIHTRFLNKFLDFFKLNEKFDLNIEINKDDIFWFNVCREVVLEKSAAVRKFNQMKVSYGWKKFQDIYDTVIKLSYDYVTLKIKERLISKQDEAEKRPKTSNSTNDEQIDNDINNKNNNQTEDDVGV